jgi:PadR family transcriptional regulator PadR
MPKGSHLGEFEQHVLAAILRLRDNAYGVTIRREIAERTGRDAAIGAVYATLDRLERKGFVSSRAGEPTRERGGRAKRYFKIEGPGTKALNESYRMSDRMREGLPVPVGVKGDAWPSTHRDRPLEQHRTNSHQRYSRCDRTRRYCGDHGLNRIAPGSPTGG